MMKGKRRETKKRLAWDCGDKLLKRLKKCRREKLRRAISDEVLAALQYHSSTDDVDHVLVYLDVGSVVVDYQLPACQRKINLRELVEEEIEMRGGSDEVISGLENLFSDLASQCKEARLEDRPAAGASTGNQREASG